MRTTIIGLMLFAFLPLSACDQDQKQVDQEAVRKFFAKNKVGSSPDYAIMKNGTDYLATIHGYTDDRETCLQLIEPYNKTPSLSVFPGTYTCVALNK